MRCSFIGVISVVVVVIAVGLIIAALITAPLQAQTRVGVSDPAPNPLLQQLARDNTAFGMDLYVAFRENEGNLFFSPYSISEAFAMLYAGARGQTADEMAKTLHISLDVNELKEAYQKQAIGFSEKNNFFKDDRYKLNIANGLWTQEGFPIREEYASVLRDYYHSEPASLDFGKDADGARRIINTWVSDKTEGMIKDILPPNALNSETQLVLANTIYFEAGWFIQFLTRNTNDSEFHRLNNTTVTVPMMHSENSVGYTEETDWQAAQFLYMTYPYHSGMAMMIILPRPGKYIDVENKCNMDFLSLIDESMQQTTCKITLPKFNYTSPPLDLRKIMVQLGMKSVFAGDADLSGISPQPLILTGAYHKASISVDEEGTIAAAATVPTLYTGSVRHKDPIEFTADRPFIFLIRDLDTKAVLFMGRVVDPTE